MDKINRVVMDLDNTLIPYLNVYNDSIMNALGAIGFEYSKKDIEILKNVPRIYNKYFDYFDKTNYCLLINKLAGKTIPSEFLDYWFKLLSSNAPENDFDLIDTIKYLKSKYELVVLTDWFTKPQVNRLKKAKIYDYFLEVIGTDSVKVKPNKEGFIKACKDNKYNECVMVGDNLFMDIAPAKELGMMTILADYDNKYMEYDDLKINHIKELKKIL